MRTVNFHADALADYRDWERRDPKMFERINRLIAETRQDPFKGIGKPAKQIAPTAPSTRCN